jgi:hypothetical protein
VKERGSKREGFLTALDEDELHRIISKASPPYTRDEIIKEGIGFYGK